MLLISLRLKCLLIVGLTQRRPCKLDNDRLGQRVLTILTVHQAGFPIGHIKRTVRISGSMETIAGMPVAGTNVYSRDSYDGGTIDSLVRFGFTPDLARQQVLVVSFLGYDSQAVRIDIDGNIGGLIIRLVQEPGELDEVMIITGTFEAGDRHKSVILRPEYIALTAGAKTVNRNEE